ncbi:hypothetical protein AWZ03_015511, partial [Drosophila navojoa]
FILFVISSVDPSANLIRDCISWISPRIACQRTQSSLMQLRVAPVSIVAVIAHHPQSPPPRRSSPPILKGDSSPHLCCLGGAAPFQRGAPHSVSRVVALATFPRAFPFPSAAAAGRRLSDLAFACEMAYLPAPITRSSCSSSGLALLRHHPVDNLLGCRRGRHRCSCRLTSN